MNLTTTHGQRHWRLIAPTVLLSVALLSAACDETGATRDEARTVELDGATSALVKVTMGAGALTIDDGVDEPGRLLDADFTYNVDDWEPDVDYFVTGDRGELTVDQPGGNLSVFDLDDVEYDWDLALTDDVPIDLEVETGAGENTLRLGDTRVTDLDVETGAGETLVDLSGVWSENLNAHIESGAGKLTVRVPKDIAVRIETDTGVVDIDTKGLSKVDGDYVNDSWGETDVELRIKIVAGVGEVDLEVVPD